MKRFLLYLTLALYFGITVWFWWQHSGSLLGVGSLAAAFLAVGRIAGLLAMNLILLQLVLIGRIKWVETVFGLDKLSRQHRTNGYIILGLVLLHPTLITLSYSILNQTGYFGQLFDFLTNWQFVIYAFVGYLLLLLTVGLSISIVRRRLKYETWWYVHFFNYVVIALVFWHQIQFSPETLDPWFRWYWYFIYFFALGNLIWFRLIMMVYRSVKHKFRVSRVVPEGVATSVYITGEKMAEFPVRAGQFMFFRFAQDGFRWQKHPFSLSMLPKNNEIRLTAKRLGDFTDMLPQLRPGTSVIIDGPHGTFTEDVITKDKLLFIAGGIGITPIRSLLESLAPKHKDMILLYSNKTRADIVFGGELAELSKQYGFKIINILSDEVAAGFEHGRIDKPMLARLVPDLATRDVFLCGPQAMMLALRDAMAKLGLPKQQLHWERFAL